MRTLLAVFFFYCLPFLMVGGWLTHLFVCFTAAKWGFLIAGAIFFPIGVIHGIGIIFGIW